MNSLDWYILGLVFGLILTLAAPLIYNIVLSLNSKADGLAPTSNEPLKDCAHWCNGSCVLNKNCICSNYVGTIDVPGYTRGGGRRI